MTSMFGLRNFEERQSPIESECATSEAYRTTFLGCCCVLRLSHNAERQSSAADLLLLDTDLYAGILTNRLSIK